MPDSTKVQVALKMKKYKLTKDLGNSFDTTGMGIGAIFAASDAVMDYNQ